MNETTRYLRSKLSGVLRDTDRDGGVSDPLRWEPVAVLPLPELAALRALWAAVNDDELAGAASAVKLYRESLRAVVKRLDRERRADRPGKGRAR